MSAVESPAPPAGGLDSGGLVPSNDRMARHRADAQQNRTQLLDAAEAAFVEMGLNAPLDLIAQRAGVARITLFRNFADRQALIMALLQRGLQEVEAEATRVADQDDGFLILLRFVADRITLRSPLIDYWQQADRRLPEIQTALERLTATFYGLIERASAAGACRKDLQPADVLLLLTLMSGALYGRNEAERRDLADRAWRLVNQIITPHAAQRVPALELAIRRQENGLRLLTGDLPGAVERGRFDTLALPQPGPGLPSSLLVRRPDIAQAEAQLVAADASLAASRAALLPQVRLTGSLGELFIEHLDPVTVWSLGGSLLAPLFDGGRLSAQAEASEARRDQAAFAYRREVLGAFAEVENALEGTTRLETQARQAEAQRAAQDEALFHARNRYRAGYAAYLEELDAQRGLFSAELMIVQLRENQLLNAVALYQALGGGWNSPVNQEQP